MGLGALQPSATGSGNRGVSAALRRPLAASSQRAPAVRSAVSLRTAPPAATPEHAAPAGDKSGLLDRPLSDQPRRAEAKSAPKVKTLEELRKVGSPPASWRC